MKRFLLLSLLACAAQMSAATYVVDSNGDVNVGACTDAPNDCTLRGAMNTANANPGADIINFAIPGDGVHTIAVGSGTGGTTGLPTITDAVTIDGTTQPGYSRTPLIELSGLAVAASDGISIGRTNGSGGGDSSTLRGLAINRFSRNGISIYASDNNTVTGCFIGTDVTGTVDLGNTGIGVEIDSAANCTIGGVGAGARNLISGNGSTGVAIVIYSPGGNLVQGNYIGTDITGTVALGNAEGVEVQGGISSVTIGGTEPGAGNLISGNNTNGVRIRGNAGSAKLVQGNFIGTDITGTVALENGERGVFIDGSPNCTIDGVVAGARNIISGNGSNGVEIAGGDSNRNLVQGNFIGTDVTGTVALGTGFGVFLNFGAAFNLIGGTAVEARNIISGNAFGVTILGFPSGGFGGGGGNTVQGNFIGTDVTGTADLGNTNTNLVINAYDNIIGGSVPGAGNTIAYSGINGITVIAGTGNQIFGNRIFRNGGLGIDLSPPGVTPNDPGDADAGPNNLQNFPVITSAVASGGVTTIQGTLDSTVGQTFFIDLYSSSEADPTGFGEGQNYLGSVEVSSNSQRAFSFITNSDLGGQFITATATSATTADTSEFSAAVQTTVRPTPSPSPSPSPTATPTPTPSPTPTPAARPLNVSTRLRVQTGDNVLIGGFIIRGSVPKSIIVRALGQTLSDRGLGDVLADPTIELRGPGGELIAQNDNWRDTQEEQIRASGLAPENDSESAIIATLPPEGYTVIVRGKNESSGVALVEGYDLDPAASSQFANISTRGFVETDDGVLIGGFILGGSTGGTQVALRGLGQSLANSGLRNVLANPTLDLRDANGTRIGFNDDWMDNPAQAVQLSANGLDPQDPRESGIFTTLAPGPYTVILAGKDGGTGVGLVEIYKIEN